MGRGHTVIATKDGKTMAIETQASQDLSQPLPDEKGVIPEFVNISNKKQIITVPGNPGNSIHVNVFGILRGGQWRTMFKIGKTFGQHPPLIERTPNEAGEFDTKYLLTREQMVREINALANPDRIDSLIANAIIEGESRRPDDRTDIVTLAHNRTYALRQQKENRERHV